MVPTINAILVLLGSTLQSKDQLYVLHVLQAPTLLLSPRLAANHVQLDKLLILAHRRVCCARQATRLRIKYVVSARPAVIRILIVLNAIGVRTDIGLDRYQAIARCVLEVRSRQVVWDVCIVPRVCTR